MQLRKVQEMGGATLLVSLPKEWVRSASLQKGGLVSIENSSDGGLLIYPVADGQRSSEKEIEIPYPSRFKIPSLSGEITGAYLLGYDLIKIQGKHRILAGDREAAIFAIKKLIGLEIVEEDAQSITCQFLVDNAAVEPSKIFRRISAIVRAMISDTMKQVESEGDYHYESVAERDDEVDRLHFLMVRLIRSAARDPRAAGKFGLSFIDCLDYRVAASLLETAGDYAVELSQAISKVKSINVPVRVELTGLAQELDSLEDLALRGFLAKDYALTREVLDRYQQFEARLVGFSKLVEASENFAELLHVSDIIERIGRCQRDLADLVPPLRPA